LLGEREAVSRSAYHSTSSSEATDSSLTDTGKEKASKLNTTACDHWSKEKKG